LWKVSIHSDTIAVDRDPCAVMQGEVLTQTHGGDWSRIAIEVRRKPERQGYTAGVRHR
jgi:hypothetical protein